MARCCLVAGALASFVGAWEFDRLYRLPQLPLLSQRGSTDTAFYFFGDKSGSPKTYARTNIPVRLSGFGALTRDPSDSSGCTFWLLDDRGLSSAYETTTFKGRAFAFPSYHQKLVKVRVQADSLQLLEIDSIATLESDSVFTTGLPSTKAPADETALKASLSVASVTESATIAPVPGGYDFEALRVLPNGNFMASDELGPALVEIDGKTKRILREWWPGKGLSPMFGNRRNNRGFEAMAVTPSGMVVAMLQSAADNPSKSDTKESRAIRVLRFDPNTGTSKEFVYLSDLKGASARKASEVKIGDLVARSETRFLAIEHGEDGRGKYWIDLVEFDLSAATDIYDPLSRNKGKTFPVDGIWKTPEEIGMDTSTSVWDKAGILPVARTVLWGDLLGSQTAWTSKKPEGMDLIGDTGVVLLNDNDYGAQDKNSDGLFHVLPESERGVSLVYLNLASRTEIGKGARASRGGSLRTFRSGEVLRVESDGAMEEPVRLVDLEGRVRASGVLRQGACALSLAAVGGGTQVLDVGTGPRRRQILVQVVR